LPTRKHKKTARDCTDPVAAFRLEISLSIQTTPPPAKSPLKGHPATHTAVIDKNRHLKNICEFQNWKGLLSQKIGLSMVKIEIFSKYFQPSQENNLRTRAPQTRPKSGRSEIPKPNQKPARCLDVAKENGQAGASEDDPCTRRLAKKVIGTKWPSTWNGM